MHYQEPSMTTSQRNSTLEDDRYVENAWSVIGSYFRGKHLRQLVRHQIESYNDFITYQIARTINMFNPVTVHSEQDFIPECNKYKLEMFITFTNFSIHRPQIHENNGATKLMFPNEARLRNFTYSANMTLDINIKYAVRSGENLATEHTFHKCLPKIHIGKLPIMLKSAICVLEQYKHIPPHISGECSLDVGGYFIINGSEKTCLAQERAAENQIQCFNITKNNSKWSWYAEIKSVPDTKCISPKQIVLFITTKNNGFGNGLYLQIPRIKIPIPLFVVFRALGIISDKDICHRIVLDVDEHRNNKLLMSLRASIVEAQAYLTQEEAIQVIVNNAMFTPLNMDKATGIKKKYKFTVDVLHTDLFPHCKTDEQKIYFLGYMANKLLSCSFGWSKPDNRDSYLNKRLDLTGPLLNNLFRNYFNKLVKDMQKQIVREIS
jgi:DNA-directed RNA polymerase II subunit RPB2